MADDRKSVTWVVVMVIIFIAVFGWLVLADSYALACGQSIKFFSPTIYSRNSLGAQIGRVVGNGLVQLPNLPAVISWHMSNRIWLPIMIVVLEGAALIGGCAMKKVESALKNPKQRRR